MTLDRRPAATSHGDLAGSPNRKRIIDLAILFLEEARPERPPGAGRGTEVDEERQVTPESLGIRKVAQLLSKVDGRKRSTSVPLFEFPERASLMAAVAAEGFRRLMESLRIPDTVVEGVGAAELERLALAYVRWAMQHPVLFRAMYDPSLATGIALLLEEHDGDERKAGLASIYRAHRDADIDGSGANVPDAALKRRRIVRNRQDRKRLASFEELFDAKYQALTYFVDAATAGVEDQSLRAAEPQLLAHAMTALADGLAWQFITESQTTQLGLEAHARHVLDLFMSGLRAEPADDSPRLSNVGADRRR